MIHRGRVVTFTWGGGGVNVHTVGGGRHVSPTQSPHEGESVLFGKFPYVVTNESNTDCRHTHLA